MSPMLRRSALASALALALSAVAPVHAAVQLLVAAEPAPEVLEAARTRPDLLLLGAGVLDPATQAVRADTVGAAQDVAVSSYAIVQFAEGVDLRKARQALAAQGVEFLAHVPNTAYQVRLGTTGLKALRAHPSVRWAGLWQPALKLSPTLWPAQRRDSGARQDDGSYELEIRAFSGVSSAAVAAELEKKVPSVRITLRSQRAEALPYVRAAVAPEGLDALILAASAIEGVSHVAPWLPTTTMNSASAGAIQGNNTGNCSGSGTVCGVTPLWDHGITGTGQIAAVADSGTSPNAAWFTQLDKGLGAVTAITSSDNPPPVLPNIGTLYPNNKIIGYWLQPNGPVAYDFVSGHGTHVTGTVLGDAAGTFGSSSYLAATPLQPNHDLADGMAPGAQLLFQDAGGTAATSIYISDFAGTLEQAYRGGARVHNNSWGSKTGGRYEGNDSELDRTVRRNEDLLVVVSAGNDVTGAMATGSPSNAKNNLAVAALGHGGNLVKASYSNRGPARDGRTKPDIAAPGTSIVSAKNLGSFNQTPQAPTTASMSGTSMSAPTLTGNAVLMRQFFADGFYPRGERTADDAYDPSGMAMKAVLLNGTNTSASGGTGFTGWPNPGTGWGRAWLDGNLWFKTTLAGGDDSRRLRLFERTNAAGLVTGELHEYAIANVAAGSELRATLTWFDAEAAPGAAVALVNNLDLEIVAPGGALYLGNVISSDVSQTGGIPDTLNTVEQVRLAAPVAGSYTFRIKATNVPGNGAEGSDRQGYALAVSGAFALPDPVPHAAPTALAVAGNGTSGIEIGFSGAAGAQGYQLYRAPGSCATASAGSFRMVAHGAAAPLLDDTSIGGYGYAYAVRGVQNDVEGLRSDCVDAVSNDTCALIPSMDAQSLVGDGAANSCSVALGWDAASANCPASSGITYTVERDTDPYFGAPQAVATGLASTSFTDAGVANGVPYYYRVSAQDSFGNASQLSRAINITPSGSDGPDPGDFLDDVDTHSYMALQAPWQVTGSAAGSGSFSYRGAPDGQPYPDMTCASITTPTLTLVPGSRLSFKAQYNLEYQWDGVVMEISTDGGASWQDLPPAGGYPNSFAQTQNPPVNSCGFAASHGAFTGVSTAASNADPNNDTATAVFKPFSVDLSAYAGQSVQLRWRMSTDPASGYAGFLLDEVRIGGAAIFASGFEDGEGGTAGSHVCQ